MLKIYLKRGLGRFGTKRLNKPKKEVDLFSYLGLEVLGSSWEQQQLMLQLRL